MSSAPSDEGLAQPKAGERNLAERLLEIWLEAANSGEFLPSEPSLAGSLSASRPAVREALVRLEERGLIRRRHGADTVVNPAALDIRARFDEQVEQADLIRAMGREASLEVLEVKVIRLNKVDAEMFEVASGTTALQTTKRWRADGVAVMLAKDVIPLIGAKRTAIEVPADIDARDPVFALAERFGAGRVEWELVWPGAANIDAKTATLLERRKGEAALTLELMGVSRQGTYAYRASEFHLQGAFRYGLIRSVRR